jgi:hypothetical protein
MDSYAGIGSRETPADVLARMRDLASALGKLNIHLRTGGASGADDAFYRGCLTVHGLHTLFLPWKGFNNHKKGFLPTQACFDMAAKYHPAWDKLTRGGRALHARNCQQVLGMMLNDPVKFVVCWTSDGKASGGTGQALRIAEAHKIKVFNLFNNVTDQEILDYAGMEIHNVI